MIYPIAVLLALVVLVVQHGPVHAASLSVNTNLDNLIVGDGYCTLREAIINANTNGDSTGGDCATGSGADTITVPAGTYIISIAGADEDAAMTGDLDITENLTIAGAGAAMVILDGNALDRVFHIHAGSAVSISGLTIQNGFAGIGGGIFNSGDLTIVESAVINNDAFGSFGEKGGGGILNDRKLNVIGSSVSENTTSSIGGGISNFRDTSLTVANSVINNNESGDAGGGIYAQSTDVSIAGSRIIGNIADLGAGGGVYMAGSLTKIHYTIINTTISENTSRRGHGGGLWILTSGTITNSTISKNTALASGGLATFGFLDVKNTRSSRPSLFTSCTRRFALPFLLRFSVTSEPVFPKRTLWVSTLVASKMSELRIATLTAPWLRQPTVLRSFPGLISISAISTS